MIDRWSAPATTKSEVCPNPGLLISGSRALCAVLESRCYYFSATMVSPLGGTLALVGLLASVSRDDPYLRALNFEPQSLARIARERASAGGSLVRLCDAVLLGQEASSAERAGLTSDDAIIIGFCASRATQRAELRCEAAATPGEQAKRFALTASTRRSIAHNSIGDAGAIALAAAAKLNANVAIIE